MQSLDILHDILGEPRHFVDKPAVSAIKIQEGVRSNPVKTHRELPAVSLQVFDLVEGCGELVSAFLGFGIGIVYSSCKQVPKVLDVLVASRLVIAKPIEGGVQVVEHGHAVKRVRNRGDHLKLVCKSPHDRLSVLVGDALVEQANHGKGIDVCGRVLGLELRKLQPNLRKNLLDYANQIFSVVLELKQSICELFVELDPFRISLG